MIDISQYAAQIYRPPDGSHKGDNGRVLVIGGSKLFHAASFWAAAAASKIVDMVHFSSPELENNDLMRLRAKEKFWEGIVVPWSEVEHYIEEDDCILIGPGMERGEETKRIVDNLLQKYPEKKWVVDGGALQMVEPTLLTETMVVTPNIRELSRLICEIDKSENINSKEILNTKLVIMKLANDLGVTVLSKGLVDIVSNGEETAEIEGGTPGMTKGGTGDVLAGVVAALYTKSEAVSACVVASYANKKAGEEVAKTVGNYFGAAELIPEMQKVLGKLLG